MLVTVFGVQCSVFGGRIVALAWLVATFASCCADAAGQEPDLAATVDGRPVLVREVDRELERVIQGREVEPAARAALRKTAREQLVDRQLILIYLAVKNLAATEADIDQAVARAEKQLQRQDKTLAEFLEKSKLTAEEFRRSLAWQLSWQRYLQRYLTDENLGRYFEQHRREFDGTTVRVAHILFSVAGEERGAIDAALERAAGVREQIAAGKLTFAAAAEKYSAAPTARTGGNIGFIGRREPMPEPFAKAAFGLAVEEISQPVITPFGVHLIQCREIKPGKGTWQEAREELEPAIMQYLFRWTADQQRAKAKIEVFGAD